MLEILPLLKWVGGKRQILGELISLMPSTYNTYCEPFLGGGALFFALHPSKAIVNDINEELINFYEVVRDDHQALLDIISEYQAKDCEEFFYEIRALDRDVENFKKTSKVVKAARTFYLNRTCFNGLYRVNSKGFFNSPYGKPIYKFIIDTDRFVAMSTYLKEHNITLCSNTYEYVLDKLKKGDFVYLDPPYDRVSTTSFTSYSKYDFTQADQHRLRLACDKLNERGVKFMLSNAPTDFIVEEFKDYHQSFVSASRIVNSKVEGRGKVKEIIVRNYK
ncbi:MAG: Dam family site-specific DNA-(adenine-N6)-methyltransferase [Succinivibrio sp.]|jgi:DNA adenine methylase|nr:Dam family site-specific DNA-(adenine-N6)-methyltransferase [Succinivibrio sp.]